MSVVTIVVETYTELCYLTTGPRRLNFILDNVAPISRNYEKFMFLLTT